MHKLGSSLRAAVTLMLILTILLGGIYPLAIMAISQVFFTEKATGSLIIKGDKFIGSKLLGQEFTEHKYFWGRLSATTPPYNASASGGSNLSPDNPELEEIVRARSDALRKADPRNRALIPIDLVTASASGLDPHISLDAAEYQVSRVAKARRMQEDEVRLFIGHAYEKRAFGFLGEPRVNVLLLNIALDEHQKASAKEKR